LNCRRNLPAVASSQSARTELNLSSLPPLSPPSFSFPLLPLSLADPTYPLRPPSSHDLRSSASSLPSPVLPSHPTSRQLSSRHSQPKPQPLLLLNLPLLFLPPNPLLLVLQSPPSLLQRTRQR